MIELNVLYLIANAIFSVYISEYQILTRPVFCAARVPQQPHFHEGIVRQALFDGPLHADHRPAGNPHHRQRSRRAYRPETAFLSQRARPQGLLNDASFRSKPAVSTFMEHVVCISYGLDVNFVLLGGGAPAAGGHPPHQGQQKALAGERQGCVRAIWVGPGQECAPEV